MSAEGQEYPVDFSGTAATIVVPNFPVLTELTVESIELSAGATGPKENDALSLTNGTASVTVTAEDGTEVAYTIAVVKKFTVTGVDKSSPTKDRRHHYVLFQVSSGSGESLGRHKLALKLKTAATPTATEMTGGAGVYRVIKETEKRVLLAYPLDSGIKSFTADNLGKAVKHGAAITGSTETVEVDTHLLAPGNTYMLYALKDGGQTVEALAELGTDVFDATETLFDDYEINDLALNGDYTYDADDAVFIVPWMAYSSGTVVRDLDDKYIDNMGGPESLVVTSYDKGVPQTLLLSTRCSLLFPLQFTDGTATTYTLSNGKEIRAFLVAVLMENIASKPISWETSADIQYFTMTLSVDQ